MITQQLYRMTRSCVCCGCVWGFHTERSGQHVIHCGSCRNFVYNAPKIEFDDPEPLDLEGETIHYLYRLLADDGSLLYVGESNNWTRRLKEHHQEKGWFKQVRFVEVQRFPSAGAAKAAERKAIEEGAPAHNIVHKPFLADQPFQAQTVYEAVYEAKQLVGAFLELCSQQRQFEEEAHLGVERLLGEVVKLSLAVKEMKSEIGGDT
jgi:hypothetical protein